MKSSYILLLSLITFINGQQLVDRNVCISIKWNGINGDIGDCKNALRCFEDFIEKNSNNTLKIETDSYICDVPFNKSKKNLNKAETYCIKEYEKKHKKANYYGIINNNVKDYSNSGNSIGHMQNDLCRTYIHESLHGGIYNLGHSGMYENGLNTKYEDYGDRSSVMGKYPSNSLTSTQYKYLKWINNDNIITYNKAGIFNLKKINNFNYIPGLYNIVIIYNKPYRNIFLSFMNNGCKKCIGIHLSNDGSGSALVDIINDNYKSNDLNIEISNIEEKDEYISFFLQSN